ncbi:hypothetical protein [Syntrophobacter fumaroxidans]|uniref:Uncharacterized protein n=1 Tax=Syntrophobacter fumaroxidans (strain DSM 10017 / MPOB) TaxID=335543 RepID=A0LNX2_SYNFM|nr:hypothetical protein [Syntrophobacter fumaroxidans]ABK19124.1 hypothetical protein Sfum_3453 [Syntrophobacter fumaroxidans MPOB]
MVIDSDILEKTCKDMIETILFCLSDATKGTIYRIGPMPTLRAVRITSGIRVEGSDEIQWGLPEVSDYNSPGKTWEQYRDRPGHVLEAMAWCVEKGKSWTADDPYQDNRSVRKQLTNEPEDYHHMEPVLISKSYLYGDDLRGLDLPRDHEGKPIWKDCEFVVVAVVKIHFRSDRIRRGDRSTKIIKKLSRTLGTELLSLHVRETLSEAQKELARQRLQSCNVLAHELRNTLIKLGFIFSAINAEISYLREQWEAELEKAFPELESKKSILRRLNELVRLQLPQVNGTGKLAQIGRALLSEQEEMAGLALMPQTSEKWLENKIRPKWRRLLMESDAWAESRSEIQRLLDNLQRAIWMGTDSRLASKVNHLPEDLKAIWPRLAYVDFSADKLPVLDEILQFLDHPALTIPHKQQTRKILTSLKALAEMIPEVEERANRIIHSLRNGSLLEEA